MTDYVVVMPDQQTVSASPTISAWTSTRIGGNQEDKILQCGPWNPGWGGLGSASGKIRIRDILFEAYIYSDPTIAAAQGGDQVYLTLSEGPQTGASMITLGHPMTELIGNKYWNGSAEVIYPPREGMRLYYHRRGCITIPQTGWLGLQYLLTESWAINPIANASLVVAWEPLS